MDAGSGSGSGSASGSGSGGPCGHAGAIRDDFDDNAPADQWQVFNPSATLEVNQRLEITPTSTPTSPAGYYSVNAIDMTNQAITVEVPQMVDIAGNTYAYFQAGAAKGSAFTILQKNGQITFGAAGMNANGTKTITYNPNDHHWWRIADDLGKIHFYTSANGTDWVLQDVGDVTTPSFAKRVHIVLAAGTDNPHGTVAFDNLNLGNPAETWCKSHTFVDAFDRNGIGDDWLGLVVEQQAGGAGCVPMVNTGAHFDQGGKVSRCWLQSQQGFDLANDHVTEHVPNLTRMQAGWSTFFRVVSDHTDNAFQLYFQYPDLCAQLQMGAPACVTYDPSGPMDWWRIGETNGTLSFEYGPDGQTWTAIPSTPIPETPTFSVGAVHIEIGTALTVAQPGGSPPIKLTVSGYDTAF